MSTSALTQKQGFTIVEVVVASLLVTLLGAGVLQTTILARRITYSNAQRVAAFGLAKALTEELKGVGYEELTADYIAGKTAVEDDDDDDEDDEDEDEQKELDVVNLGGVNQNIITGIPSIAMEELTDPRRKRVTVTISWNFQGRELEESVEIFLYPQR